MQRKTSIILAAVFAAILGAGFLVGCNASCGIGGGPDSPGAKASQAVSDAGDTISNVPGVGILGSLLKILGGVGVAYFGAKTVASKEIAKEQAKDFTTDEAANMKHAMAQAELPTAPKA